MAKKKKRLHRKRIALAYSPGAPFQERISYGVARHARERGWDIVFSPEGDALTLGSLVGWPGEGAIAMIDTAAEAKAAKALAIPVVNIASSLRIPSIPTVSSNQRAIGRLAAETLLRRNFRRFAFYGLRDVWYSEERLAGFREKIEEAGFFCDVRETESSLNTSEPWRSDREELSEWLCRLDKPVGIFASHDYRARIVSECCADNGIRIPREIALVGVDDDPLVCGFAEPTLTSIQQDGEAVGRVAAETLERLVNGESLPSEEVRIDPIGVVERGSTETMAVQHPTLRRWLDLVERHHCDPVDAAWLAEKTGASRRRIELLCREELDCSPHEMLSSARVETAKTLLLSERRWPLGKVARRCGFSDGRRLSIVFERVEGISAREFRNEGDPET